MFAAVIPAQNEESQVGSVIRNLLQLPLDVLIPVVNGCYDQTLQVCLSVPSSKIYTVYFPEPLGIDVPRAIGAHYAKELNVKGVLFIDGDMTGNFIRSLEQLILSLELGIDCALTNCYPYIYNRNMLAKKVLRYRELVNRKMNLFEQLGLASLSHGPHAVSQKLLQTIPVESLAIPPVELAVAKENNLSIEVATAIPHHHLGSPVKSLYHATMIAYTIIGDCIEALAILDNSPRSRYEGNICYDGYHSRRRFDLLHQFLQYPGKTKIFHS
jgi:hypothetical protein